MRIYNTFTRKKEEFIPIESGKIKMYSCGPTVYNYFHIGNARAFLFFDVVRRYFEYTGNEVIYVQNITDIDDKIIAKAISEKTSFEEVAAKYISAFYEDCDALGINKPSFQPKASEYIKEMIDFISLLVERGYAYPSNSDVYFSINSFAKYGELSGKIIEEQRTGARVEENVSKRHPADFTLWKAAKPDEPSWNSPWGKGRPGWHTECVVMSQKLLGKTFDIHGGGSDLAFPHHENERAQAEVVTGQPMANYWMHNGFINIDGTKMSKSLDNFFLTRDVLQKYSPDAVRFFFLSKHYRSPIDYNVGILDEAEKAVSNLTACFEGLNEADINSLGNNGADSFAKYKQDFSDAMDDDFNTAKAIAVLFDLSRAIKVNGLDTTSKNELINLLYKLGKVLGFFRKLNNSSYNDSKANNNSELTVKLIELLINYRMEARDNKNWVKSDQIRDELSAFGIILKDNKNGTTWDFKKNN